MSSATSGYRLLLARALEWLRWRARLSADDMASACRLTRHSVQRIENGTTEPSGKIVDAWLAACRSSPALLSLELQSQPVPPRWLPRDVVAEALAIIRERADIPHDRLARACGRTAGYVRDCELPGRRGPSERVIAAWLRCCHASIDYFGAVAQGIMARNASATIKTEEKA